MRFSEDNHVPGGYVVDNRVTRRVCENCPTILRSSNPSSRCSPCDEAISERAHLARTKYLSREGRIEVILATLDHGPSTVYKLSQATWVSDVTIRGDLLDLIADGRIVRGKKAGGVAHFILAPPAMDEEA